MIFSRTLAESSVVPGLFLVPHGCRFKVSCAGLQMALHLIIIQRNSQPWRLGNLDVALVNDRLVDAGDQILPEWHVERMIFEREKIASRCCAMNSRHAAYRSARKMHGHGHTVAKCHVADLVRAQNAS